MAVAGQSLGDWPNLPVLKPFNPRTTRVSDLAFSSLIVSQPITMDSVKKIYMVSQKRRCLSRSLTITGSPDTGNKSYHAMLLSYEPSYRSKSHATGGFGS